MVVALAVCLLLLLLCIVGAILIIKHRRKRGLADCPCAGLYIKRGGGMKTTEVTAEEDGWVLGGETAPQGSLTGAT